MAEDPEPWLRGSLADVHPLIRPVFFSFAQVREDLDRHTVDLNDQQVWQRCGKSSLGFHLKHLAGSVDRLGTYLLGSQLSAQQLVFLQQEQTPLGSLAELIEAVHAKLSECEGRLRLLNPNNIYETRTVGRRRLPTTVIGLLIHLAEHTQRHLGQAITLSQLVRASHSRRTGVLEG